jgi:hypothetical protein
VVNGVPNRDNAVVTHSFAGATRGAVGVIQVGHPTLMAAGH